MTASITADDVEAIERATLNALPPLRRVEDDRWILSANRGVIGRANSIVTLKGGTDSLDAKLARAIGFYIAADVAPAFRVSAFSGPEGLIAALEARGFSPEQTTLVMTVATEEAAGALAAVVPAGLAEGPDADWRALFMGPGVSKAEGEERASALQRAGDTIFAQTRAADDVTAIGALSGLDGWAGIHGMRTAAAYRRHGLARRVLRALVDQAQTRGFDRLFLQVEAANFGAIELYRSIGFVEAYRYDYWRRR